MASTMMRGSLRPVSRLVQRRILSTAEKRAVTQVAAISRRTITTTSNYPRIFSNTGFVKNNRLLQRHYASKSFPEHTVIAMPALSPTMTQGAIGTWQKKPGDPIAVGDVLVEIETDKAQMDFECQEEGFLAKILVESGEKDVAVGTPIAVMVEDESTVDAFKDFTADDAGGAKPAPKPQEEEKKEPETKAEDSAPPPKKEESSKPAPKGESKPAEFGGPILASPIARRIALEKGVPLAQIKGTGPGGRIIKADVEKYTPPAAAAPSTAAAGAQPGPGYTDIPLTGMRKTIAKRLSESMYTSPHYYITSSINMSKMLKLRKALNDAAAIKDGKPVYRLSVNDFIVKAVGCALLRVPEANSQWLEKEGLLRLYSYVDISIAVATDAGLITPIVRGVQSKGIRSISDEIKVLGKKARDGKLKPEEFTGGTFTISNLGMFESIEHFTAIINPPQSCILAVGSVKDELVPNDTAEKGYTVEQIMKVTMSCDHRTVDGAVGARYMNELKKILENPLELVL